MAATVETLAIIGAGTMGAGIGINAARHGFTTRLIDLAPDGLERARLEADKFFQRQAASGRLSAAEAGAALARLSYGQDLAEIGAADLVIEAVFEDFTVKTALLRQISPFLRPETVVATNTSALIVSDLAAAISHPERFLGLHYFSPAAINPVVEVVKGAATSAAALAAALDFCARTQRLAISCKDNRGFAINRFFCPYSNEAVRCLDAGLGSEGEIDWVAGQELGVAAGPFAVMNIIRPRVNLHAVRNLLPLGPFYQAAAGLVALGEAGGSWSITAVDLVPPARAAPIADRLCGSLFLPVLQSLDEEVALPAQIDQGATQALKFGKAPCALMDMLGAEEVRRRIMTVAPDIALPRALSRVGQLLSA
jgi:3-hydroxyacyl-CoA dehydrogenase